MGMKRKYSINDNFFETWSPKMAYLVGFIAADGCIYKAKNCETYTLSFGLAIKDIDHLHKINLMIGSNYPVHTYSKKTMTDLSYGNMGDQYVNLAVHSKKIFEDLIKIGITPRKSLTLDWLSSCPKEFVNHMIRGMFDGDGCIQASLKENCKPSFNTYIIGTYSICTGIYNEFNNYYGKVVGGVYSRKTYYTWSICGNNSCFSFFDWLYKDSDDSCRLSRKYEYYKNYKELYYNTHDGRTTSDSRLEHFCLYCNKGFFCNKKTKRNKDSIFCSRKCYSLSRKGVIKGPNKNKAPVNKPKHICPQCGLEFERYTSMGKVVNCSKKCAGLSSRGRKWKRKPKDTFMS